MFCFFKVKKKFPWGKYLLGRKGNDDNIYDGWFFFDLGGGVLVILLRDDEGE